MAKEIFQNSDEFYWDNLRKRHIMIAKVHYKNKDRKMMLAYDKIELNIEGVTIHPITDTEIKNRLEFGRWQDEKARN